MIAQLRGTLAAAESDWVVLDVGGVGYKVNVPLSLAARLPGAGVEILLYTYMNVREDAIVLYGFGEREEEKFFERLLDVNGVGPKGALALLSSFSLSQLQQAILLENVALITTVPGIGKKTAQRIIIDLKDRLAKETLVGSGEAAAAGGEASQVAGSVMDDARQTLVALGYAQQECGQALAKARSEVGEGAEVGELVKKALRFLAKF